MKHLGYGSASPAVENTAHSLAAAEFFSKVEQHPGGDDCHATTPYVSKLLFWNLPWSKSRAPWSPAPYIWMSLVAGGIGLVFSLSASFAVWHREKHLAELELSARASGYAQTLQFGIDAYMRKVSGLRALFDSTNNVGRDQFERFTKQLLSDQSAILGMSWVPRVTRDQRDSHERAGARDGLPDYRIKSVASDGSLAPSPDRSEYLPVFYTATEARDSRVYGLDLNDGSIRQQTLERARDGDRLAVSPHFTLQRGEGDRTGFFVAAAVYRRGLPHETVQDRNDNLVGFVQSVFQTSVLLETIINTTTKAAGLDLYVFPMDSSGDQATPLYFDSTRSRMVPTGPQSQAAFAAGPHWSGALSVGDANWTLIAVPIPDGPAATSYARGWVVLICGLLLSSALMAYIWRTGQHAQRLRSTNKELDQTLSMLSTQNLRIDTAINNMVQGFLMFDSAERIAVCNDRYIEMYGLSREIVKPGCSLLELLRHRVANGLLKIDPDQYRADLVAELSKGKIVKWIIRTADKRDILITNKPLLGGGWVATHEDVTERRRAEAKISHMALHDGLTDLPNRHLFSHQVESHFGQLGSDQKFAVLCLDLDRFKNVNDTFGHPFGDRLLEQVGARLRGCVRQSDSVARIAGDEFAVLQSSVTDRAETASLAARIVDTIGAPFDLDGHQVVIGVSVGIAVAPTDATDSVQLLKAADLALYRAKADGRGTYRFFESAMDQRMQARRALELDLRKALANDEFVLRYQPLVNLRTGQISGFEALIRWNHPERGMTPPADFIPFGEETALIGRIGEWVLRTACEEASKWPSDVRIAVNLSPVQFRISNLYEVVCNTLSRSHLAANRLELEVTESALLLNQASTLETMRQLRALGVRIAMDDFGTGHSSLSYLRCFPFDRIKIDCSFIHDLSIKKDSRAIIRAVAHLASSLGMETTAEGIETQAEFDYVKRVGCTEGQGYFFGKAQPAKEVYALLAVAREAVR
jgi:diguanylate cyclase (GGDEF)-like protein